MAVRSSAHSDQLKNAKHKEALKSNDQSVKDDYNKHKERTSLLSAK